MEPNIETLAIIPARGGSKSIPGKNLVPLVGKPLIAHAIQTALSTPEITRVTVSTDDREIAATAKTYGGEIVWRPAEISGDSASSESALLHTLETLEAAEGYTPELVVFLQCTSPLTKPEDIQGTIQVLLDENADSALAAAPFHYFLWQKDESGEARGINHDKKRRPLRQERQAQYIEAGAVYVMRTEGFKQARHRFFGKTVIHVMPGERCFEIDDYADIKIAEALLGQQLAKENAGRLPQPVEALVMDFDGVFTDNRVVVFQDGSEAVVCSRSDGWGTAQLKKRGIRMLVLSAEPNPVVKARCEKLGLACQHGVKDKLGTLVEWLEKNQLKLKNTVYLGNDLNDLECLKMAGCAVVVADAHPDVIQAADIVLTNPGGKGAVRELADLILVSVMGSAKGEQNA